MKTPVICLASLMLLAPACKKEEGAQPTTTAAAPASQPAAAPPTAAAPTAAAPAAPKPGAPETPTDLKDPQGVETTPSGLKYRVLTPPAASGPRPQPTDRVTVHYSGWLEDGTLFDSSVTRGQPATFPLNRGIAGWTEGVGLMSVGEKRRFWIPYQLAYGEAGRPPKIPPKATLIFDVELIKIN
ncbi:MAG: FKBP-type peptidyl-prolyl cis-trans isomerase [Myxococcota bacterium]